MFQQYVSLVVGAIPAPAPAAWGDEELKADTHEPTYSTYIGLKARAGDLVWGQVLSLLMLTVAAAESIVVSVLKEWFHSWQYSAVWALCL